MAYPSKNNLKDGKPSIFDSLATFSLALQSTAAKAMFNLASVAFFAISSYWGANWMQCLQAGE